VAEAGGTVSLRGQQRAYTRERLVRAEAEIFERTELDEVLAAGSRAAMRDWMAGALRWMETNRAVMTAPESAAACRTGVLPNRRRLTCSTP
jgi:hypothetical protein